MVYVLFGGTIWRVILLLLDSFASTLLMEMREVTGRFSAILHQIFEDIRWTKFWGLGSEFPIHVSAQILFSNLKSS